MVGVDLRTIQVLGGWKEIKMTERYAYFPPSHKAAAVERIAAPSDLTGFTTREVSAAVNH